MKSYRITFYRKNFAFCPPLNQEVDIVFTTDIPNDDEHIEEFEEFAFKELKRQYPFFDDYSAPYPDISSAGWSSILSDYRYTEIELATK